ncbi:NUDIX hydrolase [Streptomyces virens]|nr:NUDIX hydrolase [Streptomyces calvus]
MLPCARPGGRRPPERAPRRRYPSRMTTTQDTQDYAAYIASLPRVLAGATVLFRDEEGRVLIVEPNYREGWVLPGGTIESDDGESPREAARRETAEEIGLDREPGRLLAVDWVRGSARPPVVVYLYDGGVLGEEELRAIRLQESELLSWRLVPREDVTGFLRGDLGRRVLAGLDVLADGSGTAELEDGYRVR